MTINEEKRLRNYINGLVRESIMEKFDDSNDKMFDESGKDEFGEEEPDELDELRRLCEGFARKAVINERRRGGWKGTKKGKNREKGTDASGFKQRENAIVATLNDEGTNAAPYFYKLYGAKSKKDKATARGLGYKKAKHKKNDKGDTYRFNPHEINTLYALLNDRD